jgi:hypothetical protein
MEGIIAVIIVDAAIMCGLGAWVASVKGRDSGEGLLLGLLFGPFGVLIEALLPNIAPPTAEQLAAQRAAEPAQVKRAREHRAAEQARWHAERKSQEEQQKAEAEKAAALAQARREALKAERQLKQDAFNERCRERGIKPGPFAWYFLLSDLGQAATLGLMAGLVVAIAIAIFVRLKAP